MQAVSARGGSVTEIEHVLAKGTPRARRTAVNAGGAHADDEPPVGGRVTALHHRPAGIVVEIEDASQNPSLVGQKAALGLEASGVPSQRARRSDHAVARDDDRERVASDGSTDGTSRAWPHAEVGGDPAVSDGRAVGHSRQRGPYPFLQGGAGSRQLQVERRPLPGEVLGKLRAGAVDDAAGAVPARRPSRAPLMVREIQAAEPIGIVRDEQQRAERAENRVMTK